MAAGSEKRSPDGHHALFGWHRPAAERSNKLRVPATIRNLITRIRLWLGKLFSLAFARPLEKSAEARLEFIGIPPRVVGPTDSSQTDSQRVAGARGGLILGREAPPFFVLIDD
jgi:hypothetical protein